MNNPIGSASRPITEFDYDAEDIPRIIRTTLPSWRDPPPNRITPTVLDSLGPFPDSNSGPRPRGLFDRDR
ncbi:hypothetical protein LB505_011169 [Fusarium chuoi]|nr:hypothetical protein LB505_011169 [Fusarium chuoi]